MQHTQKAGWAFFMDKVCYYLKNIGYICDNFDNNICFVSINGQYLFILPFKDHESLITIREEIPDYQSPSLFFISGDEWAVEESILLIAKSNRTVEFVNNKLKKTPQFGQSSQAVLNAEIIKDREGNLLNVLNISDKNFIGNLNDFIDALQTKRLPIIFSNGYTAFLKHFYKTFCQFYQLNDKKEITLSENIVEEEVSQYINGCPSRINFGELFTTVDRVYGKLRKIDYSRGSNHLRNRKFFTAPIPFPLQELIKSKDKVLEAISLKNHKLKLLLIDNNIHKIFKNTSSATSTLKIDKGGLISTLFGEFDLPAFQINMLGISKENSAKNNSISNSDDWEKLQPKNQNDYKKMKEAECFHYNEFIDAFMKLKIDKDEINNQGNYALKILKKIEATDFVLLDFFLNSENTYLAFDFIRDIAKIKKKKGNVSTTWYFITSAIYDSVTEYSYSGALATYHESAVVNAGDDPTNEQRRIIFLYKLLEFIAARIINFNNCKEALLDSSFFSSNEKQCKIFNNKTCNNCLSNIQTLARRYLTDYEEIIGIEEESGERAIFPGLIDRNSQTTSQLTISIINHYYWLPEADWPMIQKQIDFLKKYNNKPVTCPYLLEEIKNRSQIY